MIFGKNYDSLKLLNEMIRERRIEKYYIALVKGKIKDGRYEAYISKDQDNNLSKIYDEPKPSTKKIVTDINTLETCGAFSLLELNLLTGRSHQLRAHLSYLGHPIIGDEKYGDKKLNNFFENKYGLSFQFLYAYKVIFRNCPDSLNYLENKTLAESLPPVLKKIKSDVFKIIL